MKCDGARVLISGYIDGELSERETDTLKAHLNECRECLQYLQRQEQMQTMMKRYSFIQEPPEVPGNFASSIVAQLNETLQDKQEKSFLITWAERYRRFVFQFVEMIIHSLKVRPFTWTASMSSALILLVGVVSFELYQYSSQHATPQFGTQTEYGEQEIFVASIQEDETPIWGDMEQESLIIFEDAESPIEEVPTGDSSLGVRRVVPSNALDDRHAVGTPPPLLSDPVEDYVYSHVMEVYQERLVEDVVLVGYVQ